MKSAFSLLELIVVILIVSILASFIISKSETSIDFSIKTKVKSDIALIRSSISKLKTNKILLNDEFINSLDSASINSNKSMLFSKVLDFPLISTTEENKKIGNWIKSSATEYMVYLNTTKALKFNFENNYFVCKSDLDLCIDYE